MSIEIRNEDNEDLYVVMCRSKVTGNYYIHVSRKPFTHGKDRAEKLERNYYLVPKVREVDS